MRNRTSLPTNNAKLAAAVCACTSVDQDLTVPVLQPCTAVTASRALPLDAA